MDPTCQNNQAIVVSGSTPLPSMAARITEPSKSATQSPVPKALGVQHSSRRRTLQQFGAGSPEELLFAEVRPGSVQCEPLDEQHSVQQGFPTSARHERSVCLVLTGSLTTVPYRRIVGSTARLVDTCHPCRT